LQLELRLALLGLLLPASTGWRRQGIGLDTLHLARLEGLPRQALRLNRLHRLRCCILRLLHLLLLHLLNC
jgi:hypothetical protein